MEPVNVSDDSSAIAEKSQSPPGEGEKIYQCELCDYKTAFRASLLNHQVVHSDARPYICKMCRYAAKRKFDLKKHLQIKHRLNVDRDTFVHYMFESSNLDETYDGPAMQSLYNRTDPASTEAPSMYEGTVTSQARPTSLQETSENPPAAYYNFGGETIKCESDDESTGEVVCISSDREVPTSLTGNRLPPFQGGLVSRGMSFHYNQVIPSATASGRPVTACVSRVDSYPMGEASYGNSSLPGRGGALGMASVPQPNPHSSMGRYAADASPAERVAFVGAVPPKRQRVTVGYSADSGELGSPRTAGAPNADRCPSVSSDAGSQTGVISSSVMQNQATETRRAFHCEHCDVLFFDNAMYLMHAGLHQADNPWTCAICCKSFGEKYSFTSHFINQHS